MLHRFLALTTLLTSAAICADPVVVARGQKEEARSCIPCHSLRLIHSQRLSRTAWNKELDKTGFGKQEGGRRKNYHLTEKLARQQQSKLSELHTKSRDEQ